MRYAGASGTTFHIFGTIDGKGQPLDDAKTYHLHVLNTSFTLTRPAVPELVWQMPEQPIFVIGGVSVTDEAWGTTADCFLNAF
jgi:hypothetical protein